MNKKILLFIFFTIYVIFLFGCNSIKNSSRIDSNDIKKNHIAHSNKVTNDHDLHQKHNNELKTSDNENLSSFEDELFEESEEGIASQKLKNKSDNKITTSFKTNQILLDEALDFCQASQYFWQKGEIENAIDVLDQAYSLILKVETNDMSKLIQQKEDIRFMISKRIMEIYTSRNILAKGHHNAIPLTINKYIQDEIDQYTTGIDKKFFIEAYSRSGTFRPLIVSALKEAGLPTELSWLPLIESGFNTRVLSKARALGLWQFIPSTGYKFGLRRDTFIDERIDPIKSTQAAIAYFKELHKMFGDWTTVLAAYNCGEGKVLRVINEQKINYLDNFWDLYKLLPIETAKYVPKFIATLNIINNPKKYGLNNIEIDKPIDFEVVSVSKQIHLRDIGEKIGVSEDTLRDLNPELRHKILPQENYLLRIPSNTSKLFLSKIDEIGITSISVPQKETIRLASASQKQTISDFSPLETQNFVYHKVKSGETIYTIAKKYHIDIRKIKHINNFSKKSSICTGQNLKIPTNTKFNKSSKSEKSIANFPKLQNKHKKQNLVEHIVKYGDSLWIIAKKYGKTPKQIREFNSLKSKELDVGQILKIPGNTNGG